MYLCVAMSSVSHLDANCNKISSKPSSPLKNPFKDRPTDCKAVSILLILIASPSLSLPVNCPLLYNCFTSVNLAIIVFKAVPAVSGASRVVSII